MAFMSFSMKVASAGLAALTVGTWALLLLHNLGAVSSPAHIASFLVPLAGLLASAWVGFFAKARLSRRAAVIFEVLLLALGCFLIVVLMSFRAG
jgi:hypothetical protein